VFDPFFTVRETLRLQSGYFGIRGNDAWIDEVMHHLDLTGKAAANMRSLSGGMKRRVLVAQALVHKPRVIVLDEPTAGVDVELRQGLWQFVRRLNRDGHTIVLTTHYLEEADALADRIVLLSGGTIVADGSPHQIKSRVASRRIRCTTSLSNTEIRGVASVQSARQDGAAVEIFTSDAERVVRELLARDPGLSGLEVTGAGLEEAFLTLTSVGAALSLGGLDRRTVAAAGGAR
jgi:ABC-2 type transport system ATP-binding protein